MTELLGLLGQQAQFGQAIVLKEGKPTRVQILAGEGRVHSRTWYSINGKPVVVVQDSTSGLAAAGHETEIRGHASVIVHGVYHWVERGFTIALDPGTDRLARSLSWARTVDFQG